MKTIRLAPLVSATLLALSLSGCATNVGKTPGDAQNTRLHGQYWHANSKYSVAKNAYSFAGFDVNFDEEEVKPGSDADGFLSKLLVNGSMGYVTGGLKGLSIMSLGSLYSSSDAEYIQINQYVVFVPNPKNLPYDDESLVRFGAEYVYQHTASTQTALGYSSKKQISMLNSCKMNLSFMNKWNTCELDIAPPKDIFPTNSLYSFQAIRPATGSEIPELNLPKGNYSLIRYVFIPFKGDETSLNFKGLIFRSDNPKSTIPAGSAVSINGKDYYLFSGAYGKKGFPEKTLIKK